MVHLSTMEWFRKEGIRRIRMNCKINLLNVCWYRIFSLRKEFLEGTLKTVEGVVITFTHSLVALVSRHTLPPCSKQNCLNILPN